MKTNLKRRDFVSNCFKAGVTCCVLVNSNTIMTQVPEKQKVQKPDPKSLNYCSYKCSPECPLYKATTENNNDLRKKAYEEFRMKEKYNLDYDPDKVFCFGCKAKDKPQSIVLSSCTVRKCAIEKGYECCIECKGLASCDKELWKSFPHFKEKVIEMQKSYQSS